MRTIVALALAALLQATSVTTYNVYAVRYATLRDFPVASLVAGADAARRMDIAMMVWVLEANDGQAVLVDAGFYRKPFLDRWKPADYVRPSEAIVKVGVRPDEIYDLIISHVHWDHLDGADLFPNATVWIQRGEYEYYVDAKTGKPRNRGIEAADAAMLARFAKDAQLGMVEGDDQEIRPGIKAYVGGRHTYASQYVTVETSSGTIVLASDNLYLYENLERKAPIAQTFDASANLAAQARMLTLASSPAWVVPGHDPAVFERFPRTATGVAAIPR